MNEPTFDKDGYPTEETLQALRNWPAETIKDAVPFIARAWYYPNMAEETRPGLWAFATGGWSGNEDLMAAFWGNINTALLRWERLYVSGGLHIIANTKEGEIALDKLFSIITHWAWNREKKDE